VSRTVHTVHASLHRPVLLAGAEQGLAIFEGTLIAALLVAVGPSLTTVLLVGLYAGIVHPLAVWATAKDPIISGVYLRSLRYAGYYPAAARLAARPPAVRPSIPAPL
jgi:type IV secretory pathway TrbD component